MYPLYKRYIEFTPPIAVYKLIFDLSTIKIHFFKHSFTVLIRY